VIQPEFLEPEGVQRLHDRALLAYGGIPGLKDQGMLLSALDRPLNKLAYSDADSIDLFDLAAAYAFGLATNHAFNDGNKRTAWSACVLFLKINGIELDVPTTAITERMPSLATRVMSEPAFAAWLRTIAHPQAPGATR
jgi:death-on-curing protein